MAGRRRLLRIILLVSIFRTYRADLLGGVPNHGSPGRHVPNDDAASTQHRSWTDDNRTQNDYVSAHVNVVS
ncbi:hypothetical protein PJL15_02898 [Paenarthrobacter nitroguajacolicus]|nr:hypothetical protein [Paenarthrobacter nitroguajacolicus]